MSQNTPDTHTGFVRPSLSGAVTDYLRKAIARGDFGDRLPGERELCKILDVGRPVVRDALNNLAEEGLVVRHHGRSTQIMKCASPAEIW
jgi:DNA-binding FadR family transcriptional regulator